MLFTLVAIDKPDSLALRMATRTAHFEYARATGNIKIKLGGPFLDAKGDMAGSLIVFEAADMEAARNWAANDPYAKAGLFAQSDIRPWKPTFNECGATF